MTKGERGAGAEVAVGEFLVVAYIGAADASGFDGDLELVVLRRCDVAGFLGVLLWVACDRYELRNKINEKTKLYVLHEIKKRGRGRIVLKVKRDGRITNVTK